MRTRPNISVGYHASVYEDLDCDTAARNRAARAELPCSECGSADGMQSGWDREILSSIVESGYRIFTSTGGKAVIERYWRPNLKAITLFCCQSNDHELYSTCWQCNPNETVPNGYEPLSPEQLIAWLARECQCPDCRREREMSGPSPLVAALQVFQLVEEAVKERQ